MPAGIEQSKNINVYQLKITLKGSKPPIWRRTRVKNDTTVARLDDIFQTVMRWTGLHLHQFIIHGVEYGVPHFLQKTVAACGAIQIG